MEKAELEVLVFRWARRFSSAIAVASFLACTGSNGSTADTSPPQPLAGKIAFMRDGKIWIIDERMNVRHLAAKPGFDRPLTWSPDGSKLLFWNHSRGRWDIWVMDANGTNGKNLTPTPTGGSRSPSWSPDGTKIAFMRDNPRGLYLMTADGKSQQRLSTRGHRDAVPAWSPDGRRIAYGDMRKVSEDRVALDIFVMDVDSQDEIAEFFSFGTNDLTQTVFGLSRDDAGRFLPHYIESGILAADPFQSLDQEGVGKLVETAVRLGRQSNRNLKIGICGEHGGDPSSVAFFHRTGLNYVSCSPFRVPIARLAAAQAAEESRASQPRL